MKGGRGWGLTKLGKLDFHVKKLVMKCIAQKLDKKLRSTL